MSLSLNLRRLLVLALLYSGIPAYGDNFGRLFTSEAERRQLDALRASLQNRSPLDEVSPSEIIEVEPVTLQPLNVKFSGYIHRADGKYMIWINGKSSLSGSTMPIESAHFKTEPDEITLSTNRYKAIIKPGQVWSLEDNVIDEGYNSSTNP